MSGENLPDVVYYTHTATADTQFRLIETTLWLREANFHIVTNNALYGDVTSQVAPANANDVITFQDFDLSNIWFKNATAGSNTVIYCVGIVMKPGRRELLGL